MHNDPFRILEVPPGASWREICDAYRELLQIWHPHRFLDHPRLRARAAAQTRRLNEAFEAMQGMRAEAGCGARAASTAPHRSSNARWRNPIACCLYPFQLLYHVTTFPVKIVADILCFALFERPLPALMLLALLAYGYSTLRTLRPEEMPKPPFASVFALYR